MLMYKTVWKDKSYILFFLGIMTAAAGLAAGGAAAFYPTIWADEAFSLALSGKTFPEIVSLTARDVHPPLYYLLLKALSMLLRPQAGVIPGAKLCSLLPLAGAVLLGATHVRRLYGKSVAGMLLLMLFAVPVPLLYGIEIRMYSLSLCCVLGGFLAAADVMRSTDPQKKGIALIRLSFWTLAASYTHYFACVAMAFCFASLLVRTATAETACGAKKESGGQEKTDGTAVFGKTEQAGGEAVSGKTENAGGEAVSGTHGGKGKRLLPVLCCAAVTLSLYFPWLLIVKRQLGSLSGGYWIAPVTWYSLRQYLFFLSGTRGAAFLFALLLCAVFIYWLRERNGRAKLPEALFMMSGTAGILLVGVGASVLFRPVFVDRYLIPGLGTLLLGFAIPAGMLFDSPKKWARVTAYCIAGGFLLLALTGIFRLRAEERELAVLNEPLERFAASFGKEDCIVTTNRHLTETLAYLSFAGRCYALGEEEPALMREVFGSVDTLKDAEALRSLTETAESVWFVEYNVAPYPAIDEALDGAGLLYEKTGEGFLEGPVTFYRLRAQ